MFTCNFEKQRAFRHISLRADYVIAGGGMTGVCSAITAARAGVKVILVQDRPVLGGNASSEVRLWVLGATSHMGNNNRWSREGGVLDEILVENTFRNKEGNPVLFDMVLMDKVLAEPNITLLLNTVVYKVEKNDTRTISRLTAINPQNGTEYTIEGDLFADCTGDGTLGYLAGASFRMGAEEKEEYGEGDFTKGVYVSVPLDLFSSGPTRSRAAIGWTPLTRDGGQQLGRKFQLYDMTSDRSVNFR